MTVISLDLGTQCGWAISRGSKHVSSGSLSLKPNKFDSHGMRYSYLKSLLVNKNDEFNITHCVYEIVRSHTGTDAAHMYGGYLATVQTWCEENNVVYHGVPVGTIKKHITGKGKASKEEVIKCVKEKLGIFPVDDNQADAVALCDYILTNPIY